MMHRSVIRPALLVALLTVPAVAGAQNGVACENGFAAGFACDQIDLAARIDLATFETDRGADLWGWTDPDTGHEYALVGLTNGIAFVDVTTPTSPVYLGKLPTATIASIWRDVKVYENYAFIVADGAEAHGMQVFDLTTLRGLSADPARRFTAATNYNGVEGNRPGSSHNVVINEDTGFAYLVGSDDCAGSLHMVDIQNPTSPTFGGCFSADGYTHDAQCVTYTGPDPDYTGHEICALSQGTFDSSSHYSFVDVTDKANPVLISRAFYTDAVYAHQGWFTEDQRYFLGGDEIDDDASATTRTIIFDVADLDNPEFDFFYLGPVETTDHNLYIRGDYAFLSNYEAGLRVVDISGIETETLTEVAYFDTYPESDNESYNGLWTTYPYFESGTLIANDRDYGLFVLQPTFSITSVEPTLPSEDGYMLSAPQPNPSSGQTRLTLTLAESQYITAEVLDLTGRRVALLHEGPARSALALTLDGSTLSSGLYLVRVVGEAFHATQRVSIVH
ncbi:MAG: choice-of-anchor B family protein [Rhodothermaceae bacterium]|nr:choice-of-anchor B family protein [Rhodothermaceae bacterium]